MKSLYTLYIRLEYDPEEEPNLPWRAFLAGSDGEVLVDHRGVSKLDAISLLFKWLSTIG